MRKRPLPLGSTCYACDRPATTREHAPPRGFYPKNYRQDLIEVPACPEHNNKKCDDDNYTIAVLGVIAFAYRGEYSKAKPEPLALEFKNRLHHGSKMRGFLESVDRSPLTERFFPEPEADAASLNIVLEMAARAIYFHERARRWPGDVRVYSNHPGFANTHPPGWVAALELAILNEGPPLQGSHPEIFGYQFIEQDMANAAMRFLFYGELSFMVWLVHR